MLTLGVKPGQPNKAHALSMVVTTFEGAQVNCGCKSICFCVHYSSMECWGRYFGTGSIALGSLVLGVSKRERAEMQTVNVDSPNQ